MLALPRRGLGTSVVRDAKHNQHHRFTHPSDRLSSAMPSFVKVVEVGPRDGLQNEKKPVPTDIKIDFINRLSRTGLSYIEATSFVSAKWVPQMGDATEVSRGITEAPGVTYSALTPNIKGLESAIECGVKEVAIFAAASDAFSLRNINCNVLESFERFKPLMALAKSAGVRVRGYVSCVVGCPYQGPVAPDAVGFVAQSLLEMGCYEVSLGDTIGVGTPLSTRLMLEAVRRHVPLHAVAVHFHNTYGAAMGNLLAALEVGVAVVDSSVAGLGGCPYAKGASGNVPTEDVVFMLHGMGIKTGCDLDALVATGQWMCDYLGRPNQSKAAVARLAARAAEADAKVAAEAGAKEAPKAMEAARVALCWPQLPDSVLFSAGAGAGSGAAAATGGSAAASSAAPVSPASVGLAAVPADAGKSSGTQPAAAGAPAAAPAATATAAPHGKMSATVSA